MNLALKRRLLQIEVVDPPDTSRSSGSTNLIPRTVTSWQVDLVCAGTVIVFMPRLYSMPRGSTSVTIAASATRLRGHTFLSVTSSCRIRPRDSMPRVPASNSTASWHPWMAMLTGWGTLPALQQCCSRLRFPGKGRKPGFPLYRCNRYDCSPQSYPCRRPYA